MGCINFETINPSRLILSQEQIDDYMVNGYLSFGKILDERQIKLLQHEYDCELEKAKTEGYLTNLAQHDDKTNSENFQMLRVFGFSTRNILFSKAGLCGQNIEYRGRSNWT